MKHIIFTTAKIVTAIIVILAFLAAATLGLAEGLWQGSTVATPTVRNTSTYDEATCTEAPAPTQRSTEATHSATNAPETQPPSTEPSSTEPPVEEPMEEYHYPAEFEELIAGATTVVIFTEPENYLKDIPLSEELQTHTYKMCAKYHISAYYNFVLTVMWAESNFDPYVIGNTNTYGLMQINGCNLPWLQENLGIYDLLDPYQNIEAGVYYLAKYVIKYHDMTAALMCYECGEYGAVSLWERDIHNTAYCTWVLSMLPYIEKNIYYSYN